MDNKLCEKNRESWNEALFHHQNARNNCLQEGFKNSKLPGNNGRELLFTVKYGAKKGLGFDI